MTITDEQAKQIKEQIFQQLKSFPADKQKEAKAYIESLNNQQLEEFLIQNKLVPQGQQPTAAPSSSKSGQKAKPQQCPFCLIAQKQIPALPLYEDEKYIAVLEIKPYTQGHAILIPKKHIKKSKSMPSKAYTISNRIGKHIIKKLKAKDFQITTADDMDHAIVNIIPIYKEPLTYQRKQATEKELQELAMKIGSIEKRKAPSKKPKQAGVKISKTKLKDSLIHLPRRIP